MDATREEQERFMRSFGNGDGEIRKAVDAMIAALGPSWLTDDQMRDITAHQVGYERTRIRHNIRNRNIRSA